MPVSPGPGVIFFSSMAGLFFTLLLVFPWNAVAAPANAPALSEDRHYLEASCPVDGIQELLLGKDQRFRLSSFFPREKRRTTDAMGQWEIRDEILVLSNDELSMRFLVRSRVHSLVGEKFLYLSFKAIPSDNTHVLEECEFVDRRVITHFIGSKRKDKPASPENTD